VGVGLGVGEEVGVGLEVEVAFAGVAFGLFDLGWGLSLANVGFSGGTEVRLTKYKAMVNPLPNKTAIANTKPSISLKNPEIIFISF
jgi:hypothetical protein